MEKRDLRIVYMGTPDFAVGPLSALVNGGYNIVGVVTVPDKPAGRGRQLRASSVKEYIVSQNLKKDEAQEQIPILQPERLKNQQWLEELAALRADLFIVVAFRMLPEVVFSMPCLGTFNLHGSLLPDYRGAAPINWAIMNGEHKTGVTTFFIDRQIDCGEIIDQREILITDQDDAGTMHDKLRDVGSELVVATVDQILAGTVSARPQAAVVLEKPAPKIFKEDCRIDWNAKGYDICNKIRGLSPYPAAWAEVGERLTTKILKAHFEPDNSAPTAAEVATDQKQYLKVSCADGWIYIDKLHPADKRPMEITDFLRGFKF